VKPIENLAIGLLYYNKGRQQFERALFDAMDALKASGLISRGEFIVRDGSPVDYARETIVEQAQASGMDAVAWIDTDLIFPRDSLVRLVRMSNAGYPIAAGLYRRAVHDPAGQHLLTRRERAEWATLDDLRAHAEGGVTRVALSAGGFSIVRREVYEMVAAQIGRPWYCVYDWQVGDWCFEDTFFHRRCLRLDIPIHVDPELHAVHWSQFGPVPVTSDQPEMLGLLL
jgi:hypothetical protein